MKSIHHDTPYALWSAESGQPLAGPPLVSGGLLLAPTQEPGPPSYHGTLHAFSLADGHPHWQKPFEYALVSGLAAAQTSEVSETSEILILVATTSTDLMRGEGALVALDTAGEECWRWAPGVQRVSAPALVRSDDSSRSNEEAKVATTNLAPEFGQAVCATCDARTFVVLDLATGEELTRAKLEVTASLSAPAMLDNVAYIPCHGPHLLAVGLDGGTRWRFTAADGPDSWLDKTPVIAGDRLFAVLSTGAVLALQPEDGSLAWRRSVGPAGKPLSPPVTDGERLFIGARDGVHALDLADGHELWAFPTSRRVTAAPVVSGDVVYATCHDHHLYALDATTGRELWRYEAERRIEVAPTLAACGEPSTPCVIVADRSGTLTAIARPISAAEHEAAGHWIEAASIYVGLGQLARGAELLESHGEPLKAAELWKEAGQQEHAAAQFEAAGAWQQAAEIWTALGRPLRQAEALEAHARSLESTPCGDAERAAAWSAAARVFEAEGEMEQTTACRHEVARWLRQPIIALNVQLDKGLAQNAFSRLQFIVRNVGYGPARKLLIHARGDCFEGQVTDTRQITTLRAGRKRVDWLGVRPLAYGDSVPLCVSVEYENQSKESCVYEETIYLPVARAKADRGKGQVFQINTAGGAAVVGDITIDGGDFVGRDKFSGEDLSVSTKRRRIDAAAPSHAEVGLSIDLLVQVRFRDSPLLGIKDWPTQRQPSSVEQTSQAADLKFPIDRQTGKPSSARLEIRVLAPNFTIGGTSQRRLEVPPDRYSQCISFLLTAKRAGRCKINIEVYNVDEYYLGTIPLEVEAIPGTIAFLPTVVVSNLVLVIMVDPRSKVTKGSEGETIGVFDSRRDAEKQREREMASLRRQLEEARENLGLIEERKSQYVLEVNVPLQLVKEERRLTNRIAELEREVGVLEAAPPPLPATTHVLSFDKLSPLHFERLCLWLVEREGYTRAEHLGLAGSEQGRDVIAYRPIPQGEELWYFQCKRYKSIGARTLRDEVDKYLQLAQKKPHLLPAGVVFVVSCAVSAKAREEVGDYCDQHGLAYEFWALTELDMRVKRHPDLLREFFGLTL